MTDKQQRRLDTVKAFHAAKERKDLDATVRLFAHDIVYRLPLNASGDPAPWAVYDGPSGRDLPGWLSLTAPVAEQGEQTSTTRGRLPGQIRPDRPS